MRKQEVEPGQLTMKLKNVFSDIRIKSKLVITSLSTIGQLIQMMSSKRLGPNWPNVPAAVLSSWQQM